MNVLLVGSGGREHALAWKLAQSPKLKQLLVAPGNPGTARIGRNVPVGVDAFDQLLHLVRQEQIDLVVVGPEAPLAAGLADFLAAEGIAVFGPTAAAAQIESSKIFAKQIMRQAGVPTAEAHSFGSPADAIAFAQASAEPWVVKADGLAAGKGVVVPDSPAATLAAIEQVMATGAGSRVLLEQRLAGDEVSVLALCDGERLLPLPPARDHKRLGDGDAGPNTGGMGVYAPSDLDLKTYRTIVADLMLPVVRALAANGTPFRGVLYAGVMLTPDGPRVLEFNARFGDPETQALMPLLEGDLLEALYACATGRLRPNMLTVRPGAAACVVLAAAGYPEAPRAGDPICGLEVVADLPGVVAFHAGTAFAQGTFTTAGGRVLCITGTGPSRRVALERAYAAVAEVSFAGMQFRTDIGRAGS